MLPRRKYPVGIQTFSEIIRGGYVYVDKTDLVWELAHFAKYIFLSRPRRFGKSLLSTTLESYFRGERELFEGLKIMPLEEEWKQYPVIHLDLSMANYQDSSDALRARLMWLLDGYAKVYGYAENEETPGAKLAGLIQRAYEQTGRQVVVIIDEYDAPLLEVLHEDEALSAYRKVMQEFYQPLKASERFLRFCFITGITKISQLSIFSTLNVMQNVTLNPDFSSICGVTESELTSILRQDISLLASAYECSEDEMHAKLKTRYDGYHFSERSEEIYNPYSLFSAFIHQKLSDYWFDTGTPSYLIRQLKRFDTDIMSLDRLEVLASAFDQPTENMQNALPLLYQSGYLTIKGYDRDSDFYTLSFPNQEVRIGYVQGLLPAYVGLLSSDVQVGFAAKFWSALRQGDINQAMLDMQSYLASIPYVEGFKRKLAEAATAEGFYEYTLYLIFSMLNVYVRTQVKCAGGRVDMVVLMPDTVYVFEMKVNDTAENALHQIDERGYALPWKADGRRVVKVGVRFNPDTRVPEEWVIAE